MEAEKKPVRTCPGCGSDRYEFRHRKTVTDDEGEAVITKYRCKACQKQWTVRVPK